MGCSVFTIQVLTFFISGLPGGQVHAVLGDSPDHRPGGDEAGGGG